MTYIQNNERIASEEFSIVVLGIWHGLEILLVIEKFDICRLIYGTDMYRLKPRETFFISIVAESKYLDTSPQAIAAGFINKSSCCLHLINFANVSPVN